MTEQGFHLAACEPNNDRAPAGPNCSENCPRRLHHENNYMRRLIEHIAEMAECPACNFDQETMIQGTSFCSKHRDPIILANGFVYGWTHRGGRPKNFSAKDTQDGNNV